MDFDPWVFVDFRWRLKLVRLGRCGVFFIKPLFCERREEKKRSGKLEA